MPTIPTKYFGNFEYREEDEIQFPCGLPAFEEDTRFLLIEPADRSPLQFLQSICQPGLCFLVLPIPIIDPEYRLGMTIEDLVTLELDTSRQPAIGTDVECLALIVAPETEPPRVNLLAPIVINRSNRLGIQAIRVDTAYSHEHALAAPAAVCS